MNEKPHFPAGGDSIRVTHVVSNLKAGGAQTFLSSLLSRLDRQSVSSTVICLRPGGEHAEKIRELGVPVVEFEAETAPRLLRRIPRILAQIRRTQPDVLHTWLYYPSLIGVLYKTFTNRARLVWGLHRSTLSAELTRLRVRGTARILGLLSRSRVLPNRIVYCSPEAKISHEKFGFEPRTATVIENGVDTERFKRDKEARTEIRSQLGLKPRTALIGLVARFHPIKEHQTFLDAAVYVQNRCSDIAFLLCGEKVTRDNAILRTWIADRGLSDSFHLLGVRRDIERITTALDIAVCASRHESFSLTIAEAMSCEVPCVTTDLSAPVRMLGDTGSVVPIGNSAAMADAICELLALEPAARRTIGHRARRRIEDRWSIDRAADQHVALYRELNQ